jgi:hypothetical protein
MIEEKREAASGSVTSVSSPSEASADSATEDRAASGLRSATETIERARREAEIAKGAREREDAAREREERERIDEMARRRAEDEKRERRIEEERLAALSYAEDYRRRLRDERNSDAARERAAARPATLVAVSAVCGTSASAEARRSVGSMLGIIA